MMTGSCLVSKSVIGRVEDTRLCCVGSGVCAMVSVLEERL
jgi:hypothetical protein